jgi:hypothetical protein
MISEGDPGWERLRTQWESERRPGYVAVGNSTYQVFTPEGESTPKFQPMGENLYESLSTGFSQVAAKIQKPKERPNRSKPKS